ncbi:MAG: hypothetical protein OHK0023_04110 [Anaerolineae bacterium]
MTEIKGSPAQLEAVANALESYAAAISRETLGADEQLASLRRTFVGNRAESFFRQYDAAHGETQLMINQLRALAEDLRVAARALRAADNL